MDRARRRHLFSANRLFTISAPTAACQLREIGHRLGIARQVLRRALGDEDVVFNPNADPPP